MGRKLVPGGDLDFETKARAFANNVSKEPERFGLSDEDARTMTDAAERFSVARRNATFGGRSTLATREKNQAREEVKRIYVRLVNRIKMNEDLDVSARIAAGIHDRPARLKSVERPTEPPDVRIKCITQSHGAVAPTYEIVFRGINATNKAKPEGAARLELFIDLIPPGEPIPAHPEHVPGGRPWYLRSFTKNPTKLMPPMGSKPMLVVLWGRWSSSTGEVGPFSRTVVGRVEAWLTATAPAMSGPTYHEPALPARESSYSVTVREAQFHYNNHPDAIQPPRVIEHQEEPRRLEGPPAEDAADELEDLAKAA